MESQIDKSFNLNLKIMKVSGLFPSEDYKLWYHVYSWMVYLIFIYPVPILGMLYIANNETFDIVALADNAFILYEWGFYISKLFVFVTNGHHVRETILYLQQPLFVKQIRNEKQKKILNHCKQVCKRNSNIFFYSVVITLMLWAIRPFFQSGQRLPVDLWFPFDIYSNTGVFYTIYVYTIIGGCYAGLTSAGLDPLISGLIYQAACQFQILKDNLQYLSEYADEDFKKYKKLNVTRDEIIYKKIGESIDHHNAIIRCCKLYEKAFSTAAFSQAIASTMVICICCLELTIVKPFTMPYFSAIIFMCTMTCEVFLYCYYGTVLYYESNTLTEAIYMGKWYEFDLKSQKSLFILMERTKKPVILTAGRILDLSLITFTMVCRKAYSLLAVLQNYNN